jgi:hypothetical protein
LIPLLHLKREKDLSGAEDFDSHKESGLSKLLSRLNQLHRDNQKRRSVSEKKLQFKVSAINERHEAEVRLNKTEFNSELAETSVALIHRHMSKNHSTLPSHASLESVDQNAATDPKYIVSSRKRSLPAINQPVTTCPVSLKMARRQSVAAVPQNPSSKYASKKYTDPSVLNFNSSNPLISSKSAADADLLAIKYRISKALKR